MSTLQNPSQTLTEEADSGPSVEPYLQYPKQGRTHRPPLSRWSMYLNMIGTNGRGGFNPYRRTVEDSTPPPTRIGLDRLCFKCYTLVDLEASKWALRSERCVQPSFPDDDPDGTDDIQGTPPRSPTHNQGDFSQGPPERKNKLSESKGATVHDLPFNRVPPIPIDRYSFPYAMDHIRFAACAVHEYPDMAARARATRAGQQAHVRALWRRTAIGKWVRRYKYFRRPTPLLVSCRNRRIVLGLVPKHERFRSRVPSLLGPGGAETVIPLGGEQKEGIKHWGRCPSCDASRDVGSWRLEA